MYFIDEMHKLNYKHMTSMIFPHAKEDPEYHAMSYILSVPDIYEGCIEDKMLPEYPFLWTVEYVDKSYTEKDDTGEYFVWDFDIKKDSEGNSVKSEAFIYLSSGYKKLIYLAKNLFNSRNDDFNLMDALGIWDDRLFKLFQQAILLRKGNRQIEGLRIAFQDK